LTDVGPTPWTVGYQLQRYASDYTGPGLNPYIRHAPEDTLINSALVVGAIWGERRWRPWQSFTVDAGLRLEASEDLRTTGPLRLAPRISARYQPASALTLSAALGRSFQYTHSLGAREGAESAFGLALPGSDIWILAGDNVPAIRSDVATVGVESWIGNSWLASVNTYGRWQNGLAVQDPTPGSLLDRPLFVPATGHACGLEVSARKLTGRWTASASYSYGVSEIEAVRLRYPAPAERRHTLDATSMVRLGRSFRVGAAFTAASGAPYARMLSGSAICDDRYDPETGRTVEGPCRWADLPRVEAPGAHRAPAYQSLDLLLDWNHAFRSWEFGAYLQVRNALNHWNAGPYTGFAGTDCLRCDRKFLYVGGDKFLSGPPILPLFGFRIAF
jgi:hypothetical protein